MGIFGKIIQGAVDTITIPIDIAKDTMGLSIEEEESYTLKKLKKLKDKAEDIYDALDED